jgi:hypothetical protein
VGEAEDRVVAGSKQLRAVKFLPSAPIICISLSLLYSLFYFKKSVNYKLLLIKGKL